MQAIIGLGNPGSEYDSTRHNIGFAVVDAIAEQYKLKFRVGKGDYWLAVGKEEKFLLVKPTTYMNNSGIAVYEILRQFDLQLENILVIIDDFNIPLGTLRLRLKGSTAGHNGLASIVWHVYSDEFPRLRCGIDSELKPKDKAMLPEFVLSGFEKNELKIAQEMILQARDIAVIAAQHGLHAAMNQISRLK